MFGSKKKKARWIVKSHIFSGDDYICSNCGYTTKNGKSYCKNCKSEIEKSALDMFTELLEFEEDFFEDWEL